MVIDAIPDYASCKDQRPIQTTSLYIISHLPTIETVSFGTTERKVAQERQNLSYVTLSSHVRSR